VSDQNGQIGNPRTTKVAYREHLRLLIAPTLPIRKVGSHVAVGRNYNLSLSPVLV